MINEDKENLLGIDMGLVLKVKNGEASPEEVQEYLAIKERVDNIRARTEQES